MSFLGKSSGWTESAEQESTAGVEAALLLTKDAYNPGVSVGVYGGLQPQEELAKQRRSCSSAECNSSWAKPWRSRRRPLFEGQWGCSGRCVLAMVRSALRRETGERRSMQRPEPHRHRVPLGLVMLAQGWITHPQLQTALAQQRASGSGRIGDWLVSECGLQTDQVTRGLSVQWGCPVLSMEGFSPREMALIMPRVFVEEFGMLPLRVAGSRLIYLGCEDRLDASVALAVERMSGLKAESGLVDAAQLGTARTRLLEGEFVPSTIESSEDEDALAARITAILEQKQPVASQLVRLHQYYWMRVWLESGTKGRVGNVPVSSEDMHDYIFTIGPKA